MIHVFWNSTTYKAIVKIDLYKKSWAISCGKTGHLRTIRDVVLPVIKPREDICIFSTFSFKYDTVLAVSEYVFHGIHKVLYLCCCFSLKWSLSVRLKIYNPTNLSCLTWSVFNKSGCSLQNAIMLGSIQFQVGGSLFESHGICGGMRSTQQVIQSRVAFLIIIFVFIAGFILTQWFSQQIPCLKWLKKKRKKPIEMENYK